MKSCYDVKKLMSLYIDNLLDDKTKEKFEEHIKSCEDCCAELEKLKEVVGILNSFEEVELPSDFQKSLHKKLAEEERKQKNSRSLWAGKKRYLGLASSVAAMLILAFITGNRFFTKTDYLNDKKAAQTGAPNAKVGSTMDTRMFSGKEDGSENTGESDMLVIAGHMETSTDDGYDNTGEKVEKFDITFSEDVSGGTSESAGDAGYVVTSTYEDRVSNEVYITLKSSDYEKAMQDIKRIASLCGIDTNMDEQTVSGGGSTGGANGEGAGGSAKGAVEGSDGDYPEVSSIHMKSGENIASVFNTVDNVISFNVDIPKYDEFIDRLEEEYEGKISIVDNFPEMVREKEELEKRLKNIEKNLENVKESKVIEQLESDKIKIQADLDKINEKGKYRKIIINKE